MHLPEDDTTDPAPAPPRPEDVLRDVLALRRKVAIAIYGVITLDLPLYFLFGYTVLQVAILAVVGWVIAGVSIWFSFAQIARQRRRSAYPGLLIVNVGDTGDPKEASTEALFILEGLLSTQSSFVALRYENGVRVLAARGLSHDEAAWVMETHARQMSEAMEKRFPINVLVDTPGRGAIFVPIVSLKQSIGVLYLASSPGDQLADLSLLADIGSALGLSLENLRQKEQLQQKESRLRSVVMGAPVVLFAVDTAGAMTFIQGQGIAGLNVDPDNIIGRPVWDIWQNRPEIIQSFRRAFAGDAVTSLAELDIGGVKRVFEYRLAPECDEHGRVTGVICIATDVTQRKVAEDALRESERAKATLLSNLPGFAYRVRKGDWAVEYISDGVQAIMGHMAEEYISGAAPVGLIVHPDDLEMVSAAYNAAMNRPGRYALEFRIVTPKGETKWVWDQGQAVASDDSDEVIAIEGYVTDVTERRQAEDALAGSEMRFRDLFENARDAMFTFNLKSGHIIAANQRVVELTGYARDEFLGLNMAQVISPEWHEAGAEALKRVFNGDNAAFELEILAKDGRRIPLELASRIILDEDGTPRTVQASGRDITERRQAEETIRRLAYHDALTDLPNRALFEDRLNLAMAQSRRMGEMLAVMFLDLDSFKVVNDTLGHSAGDKLLQAVASDIAKLVREGDTVARVGGDEFTLLLAGIAGPEDATDVSQRILDSLRQPRTINGTEFRTTGSIGITTFPADGDDGETLLRNADTAMYRAKERGRDNYQLYTASMNAKMMERLAVEQDLRHALERKELTLFYQPIVSVETGQVTGAEALLRWNHPQRGIITPDEFIPLAEETGLIVEIGESVLREACLQLRAWRKEGLPVEVIAVNLSARQLQQEDLVQRVADILSETGVSPDLLQLEITEGAAMKNVDHAIAMLRQLGQMGIEITIDDFGTGYSSLTYLKRLPIDAVKIDRSFVRDLEHDASDATIVSTVIAMAENLNLNVIAEGVETEAQLEFLRERGCNEYQGYLFSRPLPAAEFAKVVRASQGDAEERVSEVA
jgi:diguanylate cyclase (GGDEF)-like protein/PAS domain S-box-containing protein